MTGRPWLKNYPTGMPEEINADRYGSIPELLAAVTAEYGELPAFHNLGHDLSYAEVDRLSRDFAAYLQSLPGLGQGDRVAVMSPNLLQYPVAVFGILRAGMTVVNVNPLYTAPEVEHQLADAGAKAIVIVENFAATLQAALPRTAIEHVIVTAVADQLPAPRRWLINAAVKFVKKMVPHWAIAGAVRWRDALAAGARLSLTPVAINAREDVAFLQYTGGTTGVTKGAMLTHRNMLANLEQMRLWVSSSFVPGQEVVIAPLPLYHVFSLSSTLAFMQMGARTVLITNPRDMKTFIAELARWKFSVMTGVNTLFAGLMNAPGFKALDFSAMKVVVGGGSAVQRGVAERWFGMTGHHIVEAYGLTETSPGVCANVLGSPWSGSVGLPTPSTRVSIRNDQFEPLPLWSGVGSSEACIGEICVSGPQVMKGYWNAPEDTAAVMQDGWLKTGDVGYMDEEGRITLTDRKRDMILVSGFNVYPGEVENVVSMLPGVLECGAVGVPDEHSGEAVRVVIVKRDPSLTREAVIEHCRSHLTGYKRPRQVEFVAALPKNSVGKVLRRELRNLPHPTMPV
ncbi:MAG: AMP-binding protein [Burkholderiaceae bacterium]